ncbi:DNA helicase UvrD [Candidatus Woesearchaeota archaeon CG10_big_fil_rev_8_21_14_0_10_37_12]|nr:MAG: DNA helicase UvrD [Candidatus Woesearchaeota archaeon CG10_big_fil_rev_8_21_14_0_10_37_12]
MQKGVIGDLHIHSKYARACSKDINVANLEKYARLKGLNLLGTGDFQHPKWLPELKQELTDKGDGILYSKTNFPFVLQTEISLIYSQDNKGRRIHNVVLCPDFETADQFQEYLKSKGRIDYDGRPIFKIPCDEFTESLRSINKDIEVIPAHVWTPWFSLFGSMSGFDSLKDAFRDQSKHIHAIETGLSSDPAMNWRLSQLDDLSIISSSDSHSFWPWRMGRESTKYNMQKMTYKELLRCIRENDIIETLEFYPEEGKYHFDGHRNCGVCVSPEESLALKKVCPKCKTGMTIGVASRVEELADNPLGRKPSSARPFRNLIPLSEIIAHVIGSPVASKKVWEQYNKLINTFGSELNTIEQSEKELAKVVDPKLAGVIAQSTQVQWKPGYDGVYGVPMFGEYPEENKESKSDTKKRIMQKGLGEWN